MDSSQPHQYPRVLIVGAGIAGLCLANLLERGNIPYQILEKTTKFKPLGSAINLSAEVFTFLDQLGIYEQLEKVSKPFKDLQVQRVLQHKDGQPTGKLDYKGKYVLDIDQPVRFGYESVMLARPDLFEALLAKIPKEKILMSKKVISIQQNEQRVIVTTSDGSEYEAELLVGAEGPYSQVRESMFKEIEKSGRTLPPLDKTPLNVDYACVVGVTEPLDPKVYPEVLKERCEFQVMLSNQRTMWYMPLSHHRMGWMINEVLTPEQKIQAESKSTSNTAWSSSSALEMCQQVFDHPTPYGTTFQDFFDKTPKQLISKVLLEDKYFETWQDGRTCLMGDACHKVLPFGASGARQAMLDALALANLLFDIPSNSYEDIRKMLEQYHAERKSYGKAAVDGSAGAGKLFHNQGFMADTLRNVVLNWVPLWLPAYAAEKVLFYRPQCTFIDFKENTGTAPKLEQEYSPRYLKMKQAKEQEQGAASALVV